MTALDDLPMVDSFFGTDLRTGSMIIAAIGIVHPMAYGCSFFMPISYLLVTIWILVSLFFTASIVLFFGLAKDDTLLCTIWVWYAVIFVVVMLMMMILLALVFTSRKQRNRVIVTIFGMLWYIHSDTKNELIQLSDLQTEMYSSLDLNSFDKSGDDLLHFGGKQSSKEFDRIEIRFPN